jgi:hypothetical protein
LPEKLIEFIDLIALTMIPLQSEDCQEMEGSSLATARTALEDLRQSRSISITFFTDFTLTGGVQ